MASRYRREVRLTAAEITAQGAALDGVTIVEVDAQGQPTGRELKAGRAGQAPIEVADATSVQQAVRSGSVIQSWVASTAYAVGDVVRAPVAVPSAAVAVGDILRRTVAGTSGSQLDAAELGSWEELGAQVVRSVAGRTGDVTLAKGDVGLGSADNTPDAAKPISTATQTALDGKAAASHTHAQADVTGLPAALAAKVDVVAGKQLSTEDYTSAEKTKLGGIATAATANATDAQLRDRSSHTGAQAIATVTGLQAALDGKSATGHTHQTGDVIGLGTAATADVGTGASQVVQLDAQARLPAVNGSQLTGLTPELPGSVQESAIDPGLDAGTATVDRASVPGETILTYALGTSTFRPPDGLTAIRMLLVAGGGGGGTGRYRGDASGRPGGGGGGGEYLALASEAVTPGQSYAVVVGAGGAGATDGADTSAGVGGGVGASSTFGAARTARGGGGGGGHYAVIQGGWDVPPDAGGSGGGGSNGTAGAATTAVAPGVGNIGGNGILSSGAAGGGGGGAGGAGGNAAAGSVGGAGGAGASSDITGTALVYAAGGGGSGAGAGAAGVSGAGGAVNGGAGAAGVNGRGGGGGGAQEGGSDGLAAGQSPGGRGGDGVVVIRWPTRTVVYRRLRSYASDNAARADGRSVGDYYTRTADGATVQVQA